MLDLYEFRVPDDTCGVTTCVVNISQFLSCQRSFPCTSGGKYDLTSSDVSAINHEIAKIVAPKEIGAREANVLTHLGRVIWKDTLHQQFLWFLHEDGEHGFITTSSGHIVS